MFGLFGNPQERMGSKLEASQEEIMETEKNLLWRGKEFARGTEDNEFTIERKKLSEIEIKAFAKALQEKYPEGDYEFVRPLEGDMFYIFAKGENAKRDDWKDDEKGTTWTA